MRHRQGAHIFDALAGGRVDLDVVVVISSTTIATVRPRARAYMPPVAARDTARSVGAIMAPMIHRMGMKNPIQNIQ
jgi:hypothetical protein